MKDLKGKSEGELMKMLREKEAALKTFRFELSGSKIRNVKQGRGLKKDIAQILTEMNRTGTK